MRLWFQDDEISPVSGVLFLLCVVVVVVLVVVVVVVVVVVQTFRPTSSNKLLGQTFRLGSSNQLLANYFFIHLTTFRERGKTGEDGVEA